MSFSVRGCPMSEHIWLNVMEVIKMTCPPLMTKLSIACIMQISDMNMQIQWEEKVWVVKK
jgi:hypothetical protein